MNQPSTSTDLATPEVLAWLAAQTARGCTRPSLFKSMLDAGWQATAAARIMQLTPGEEAAFGGLPTPVRVASAKRRGLAGVALPARCAVPAALRLL